MQIPAGLFVAWQRQTAEDSHVFTPSHKHDCACWVTQTTATPRVGDVRTPNQTLPSSMYEHPLPSHQHSVEQDIKQAVFHFKIQTAQWSQGSTAVVQNLQWSETLFEAVTQNITTSIVITLVSSCQNTTLLL